MIDNTLDKIYSLIKNIDSDWKPEIDKLGIWDNIYNLYTLAEDNRTGNILFAFVVLAYNYQSEMIEVSKDRLEVKRKIMIRLGGLDSLNTKVLLDASLGLNPTVNRIANWYAESQRDWRWPDIVGKIELHSRLNALAGNDMIPDEIKSLGEATKLRREADIMWNELRKEYLPLDNALRAEGQAPLTERMNAKDFMVWESYIRSVKTEQRRLKDEEDKEKQKEKDLKSAEKEREKEAARLAKLG